MVDQNHPWRASFTSNTRRFGLPSARVRYRVITFNCAVCDKPTMQTRSEYLRVERQGKRHTCGKACAGSLGGGKTNARRKTP